MASSKLERIRQRYREQFPTRLADLAAAFEDAQAQPRPRPWADDEPLGNLRRLAHNIAGTAGSCGLAEAGDVARQLDVALRAVQETGEIDDANIATVAELMAALMEFAPGAA